MVDYLFRHPSQYQGSIIKAEEVFNKWFTIDLVKEVTPTIH